MVKSTEFEFKDEFPRRAMIGRIYRIDAIGEGPRGRTSYEFDALDETRLMGGDLRGLLLSDDTMPFGLIRVLTTPARFAKYFGGEPREGAWYRLELTPPEAALAAGLKVKLTAWHAQLTDGGYTKQSRGYITGAEFLSADEDRPLKPLSAGVSPATAERQAAIAMAQFSNFAQVGGRLAIKALLQDAVKPVHEIRVQDVGQASFVTLLDRNARPIIHFDAGWPVSFNGKTVPHRPPICQKAAVILSHWDWDHLSGYYRFPDLRSVPWITPVQVLGFGAGRVAFRLHADGLLCGFEGAPMRVQGLLLGVCNGPLGNKNQTGLALRVALPVKAVKGVTGGPRAALLIGDADYDHAPSALTAQPLHALVVTHHGANFGGFAPMGPAQRGPAIVSVGKGNVYKHPREKAIRRHKQRKWLIQLTSKDVAIARGARWIT